MIESKPMPQVMSDEQLTELMVVTVMRATLYYGLKPVNHDEMVNQPPPHEITEWFIGHCAKLNIQPLTAEQFRTLWSRAGEFVYKQKTDRTLLTMMKRRDPPPGMNLNQKPNRKERRAEAKKNKKPSNIAMPYQQFRTW